MLNNSFLLDQNISSLPFYKLGNQRPDSWFFLGQLSNDRKGSLLTFPDTQASMHGNTQEVEKMLVWKCRL